MTKIAQALKGGIAGATTISLLSDTLKKINSNSNHVNLLEGRNLERRWKKAGKKKSIGSVQNYIQLAGDLFGSMAFLGLSPLGKKNQYLLRGGILGAAAGLGSAFLKDPEDAQYKNGSKQDSFITKALEVSLYTIGGLIAGKVIEGKANKKSKKLKKR